MEQFVVSARKYRPQTFRDVVGQQAITNTLTNAIENNHLAQALLFTGPRGVGKTTCARILAKKINQDYSQDPEEDFAFNIFELDAASNNSVDDIRNLIDQVRIPPQVGKYKVYIIDEVHMLSQQAFNAFLKTLEEPPGHAIFILATTEKHKIIPTILSRCQIFDFKRITVADAKDYLSYIAQQEGVTAEDDALHIIAQKADGAMRDALSIYDRVVSYSGKNLTRKAVTENLNVLDYDTYLRATDLILDNAIADLMLFYNEVLAQGFDGQHFISGLASHFRDLLVCKNPKTIDLLEVGDNTKQKYYDQSQKTSTTFLLKAIEMANTCDQQYRSSRNQRLLVELCLMQLASLEVQDQKKKSDGFILPPEQVAPPQPQKPLPEPQQTKQPQEDAEEIGSTPSQEEPVFTASPGTEEASAGLHQEPPTQIPGTSAATAAPSKVALASKEINQDVIPQVSAQSVDGQHSQQAATLPQQAKEVRKSVSGLSLKSIQKKRELEAQKKEGQHQPAEELNEVFTQSQMRVAWKQYVDELNEQGEKIVASIMETDVPVLDDLTIRLELPNESMKQELERVQHPLMLFLKKRLQNTHIKLHIQVNESAIKKYTFTPQEKYEKLREKNPMLEKLRITFDLDI